MKPKNLPVLLVAVVVIISNFSANIYLNTTATNQLSQSTIPKRIEVEAASTLQASDPRYLDLAFSDVQFNDLKGILNDAYLFSQPVPEDHKTEEQISDIRTNPIGRTARDFQSRPASPLLVYAVNITNDKGEHISLGTMISEDTILTHNHQLSKLGIYTAIVSSGARYTWVGAKSDSVGRQVVIDGHKLGQQTRLVTYSQALEGGTAKLASQNTIKNLKVGDKLEIVYWDDSRYQFAVGQFIISNVDEVKNGTITVDDPMRIINKGDSGGGVFFNHELVGNMWSIGGGAHIALIPPKIDERSEANSAIE